MKATDSQSHVSEPNAIQRLRMFSIWVKNSPNLRKTWKSICLANDLKDTLVGYDVATRWNSTYDMIERALELKAQVTLFLECQATYPRFTDGDWAFFQQVHKVLRKFKRMTEFVSQGVPTLSCAVPVYYALHDTLHDAKDRVNAFSGLDRRISRAADFGIQKFEKYYNLMDTSDTIYTALILDPRFKTKLLLKELEDKESEQLAYSPNEEEEQETGASLLIQHLRTKLHERYGSLSGRPLESAERPTSPSAEFDEDDFVGHAIQRANDDKGKNPERSAESDIDMYLDSGNVDVKSTQNDWLCRWWRQNQDRYPQVSFKKKKKKSVC